MKLRPRLRAASANQAKAGFVLVEMLVAMAVGAFLLVALASVTSFLLHAHGRITAKMQEAEDAGRALAAVSRDIRQAAHVRWGGREAGLVFSGTPDHLMLARAVPADNGLERMTAVLLQIRAIKDGAQLTRAESLLPPDAATPDGLAWTPPVPLYSGQSRIAFAYFMRLETGGEALLDAWPAGDEMPVAVRITFTPAERGGEPLSLRIPLLIDAEPACAVPDAAGCGKPEDAPTEDEAAPPSAAVDADDALGWGRYAQ